MSLSDIAKEIWKIRQKDLEDRKKNSLGKKADKTESETESKTAKPQEAYVV